MPQLDIKKPYMKRLENMVRHDKEVVVMPVVEAFN